LRRLMPSAKRMARMYRWVSKTIAPWARRPWAALGRWLKGRGVHRMQSCATRGTRPREGVPHLVGRACLRPPNHAAALGRAALQGGQELREEMMSEMEELKAKVEEAEQRAAKAEALLAALPGHPEGSPSGSPERAEREQADRDAQSGESGNSGSGESSGSGVAVTNPANSDAGQRARLAAAASAAARGDRRALLEWATLREELNVARRNE